MPSTSRVDRLKQMLTLEQRRADLQDELDSLVQQLTQLKDHLFDDVVPAAPARAKKVVAPAAPAGRAKRGQLKEQIIAALQRAGAEGVKVKELAVAIGTKPVNVHSWFHSALKTNKTITKIKGGHYRLASASNGSKAAAESKSGAAKPAAPKPSRGKRKGSKRGQVTANILTELKAAGSSGITVSDLAKKLGSSYKNVYIWFATTGKKQPGLKKIAPATYSLAA